MKYSPIEELNREVHRERILPLLLPFIIPIVIMVSIPVLLYFADVIGAFAAKNPNTVAGICLAVSVVGWYFFGKHNRLW